MIKKINIQNEQYSCCRDICNYIGLTKGQRQNEIKKLKTNKTFDGSIISAFAKTKGGKQKCVFINDKFISRWLYMINTSLLNNIQIQNMNKILEDLHMNKIHVVENESNFYEYEFALRDEIYNIGYFNDIKILEKEKIYEFGRIDLYGVDKENNRVCIELKKNIQFYNTKKQLLKYKNSKCFDKVIYCAFDINENFLRWLKDNQIIPYTYKRKLVLSEIS